jgi:hypothetical protein
MTKKKKKEIPPILTGKKDNIKLRDFLDPQNCIGRKKLKKTTHQRQAVIHGKGTITGQVI